MKPMTNESATGLAEAFHAEHCALTIHNTNSERAICRKYSSLLRTATPEYMMAFARQLLFGYGHRWQAYEVIAAHKMAFQGLREDELEELGRGITSLAGRVG